MKKESQQKSPVKGGRKPKSDPAIHRYGIKLNSEENDKFLLLLRQSGVEEKSKFIKAMIFSKTMKVVKIDKATTDYYILLTNFYNQFQAIGNNYNQTTRAIKTNFGERRGLAMLYKLEKVTFELVLLSKQILLLTKEFEQKFLQK